MSTRNQPSVLEVPEIHSNQFATSTNGSIKQNVNLFRGSVNFNFPLVDFTGRNGLHVQLGAQYGSNVHQIASQRNLEAPTGVMGMGWHLSYDRISATYNGAKADGTVEYAYVKSGSGNKLYRIDRQWQRGTLAKDLATDLDSAKLTTPLLKALMQQGINTDAKATVTVVSAGKSWSLSDPVQEFQLDFTLESNQINIYDGGIPYEAESYNFARIRYYPKYEKWAVTDKAGITKIFGGGLKTDSNDYKNSTGNSIQWEVRWGNWQGPSTLTHNAQGERVQQQCPVSWNLAAVTSRWEDEVRYEYLQTTQLVGADGLPYTKACYLAKVTGVFGRTATFVYADKLFEENGAQKPREYMDPNKAVPDNTPDAYQSKYETKYLQEVEIASAEGLPLYSWKFGYDLEQFASIPGGSNPDFYGNTIKRVLTEISREMPDRSALPAETYTYYQASKPNAGALQTRTYREGAATTYHYAKQNLLSCNRSLKIDSPNGVETPRVWFGSDYAVVLWYNTNGKFFINVYTWIGRWVKWQPKLSPISTNLDLTTLDVSIQNDSFVISAGAQNGQDVFLFPYHKDDTILGGWLENDPSPISILDSAKNIEVAAGKGFFVVNNTATNKVLRYTWNSQNQKWVVDTLYPASQTFGNNRFFITTANNIVVALDYDIISRPGNKKNTLELFYLDETNTWQKGDSIDAPAINMPQNNLHSNFSWTPAPWVFVASYITEQSQSSLQYNLSIYTWSNAGKNAYKFDPVVLKQYTQKLSPSGKVLLPYVAQLSSSGMLMSGPNLLRFNGQDWLENNALQIRSSLSDQDLFWFSHGSDIVLKTENTPDNILSMAQVFDPLRNSWQNSPISVNNNPPSQPRLNHYHPTGGNGYVSFNQNIYQRGTSVEWNNLPNNPILPALPDNANVTSLINAAPYFFAYLVEDDGAPQSTQLLLVQNGMIQTGPNIPENFFTIIDDKGQFVSGTNGKIPAGAQSFLTYAPLTEKFEKASSLNLHRYLNGNMSDNINAYPVFQVEVDDGFSTVVTNYEFDFSNAAIDSYGSTSKYYSVKVYGGESNAKKYGWQEFTYFNGIGLHPVVGNPTQAAGFDGLPESICIYDASGKKIKSVDYEWEIYTSILASPGASTPTPIQGSYALTKSKTTVLDGVSVQKNFDYDLSSGQEISQATSRYTALGKKEIRTTHKMYAYQVFEALWYSHCLQGIAQTQSAAQLENSVPVVASSKAITWKRFAKSLAGNDTPLSVMAAFETYEWMGGTASGDFDFASWQQGKNPVSDFAQFKGWLKKSVVEQRSNDGLPVVTIDAMKRAHSVQYDRLGQYKSATFLAANLAAQEAAYYGFEAYESPEAWHIKAPAAIVDTNAYTGSRSLCLLKDGLLSNQFCPADQTRAYTVGWWYATAQGFQKNNQSGISIKLSQNGNPLDDKKQDIVFEATNGQWQFAYARIDLAAISGKPVLIQVEATSASAQEIFIDQVRFLPDLGAFSGKVYDAAHRLVTEELGMGTHVVRSVYDPFLRLIGKSGPFKDQVEDYQHEFFSRQTRPAFSPAAPNHLFSLKPLQGGYFEAFKGGQAWLDRWTVSNLSSNWTSGKGYLVHTSASKSDTLRWKDSHQDNNYGLYFQLSSPEEGKALQLKDVFSVVLNSNSKFSWDPTQGQWSLSLNGKAVTPLQPAQAPLSMLLVATPKAILLYVNNELILSETPSQAISGAFQIETGKNKIAFKNLALLQNPSIELQFEDGAEKLRQQHALSGDNAIIGEIIYDELSRKIASTKNAPARFGNTGNNTPLLTYNTDFVKVEDFLAGLDNSGEMSGNVSTYYNGQNHASNDENYPYSRNRLEASPLARVIESGLPGKAYAIVNPAATPPASRATVKYSYASNDGSQHGLPSGQYYLQTRTDQLGTKAMQIIDKAGQILFTTSDNVTSGAQVEFAADAKNLKHLFPNYFAANIPGHDQFVQSTVYNLLGKIVQTKHPDEGLVNMINNENGHRRFVQDALGAKEGYFSYQKYDILGRIVERGIYQGSWDPVDLRQKATDPSWPNNDPKQTVQNQRTYLAHGPTIDGIGKISTALTFNQHSGVKVEEAFSYDAYGNLVSKSSGLQKGQSSLQKSSIRYQRSLTGKLTRVSYPQDIIANMSDVVYTYDQLDRLISIGEEGKLDKHAVYSYDGAGDLKTFATNEQKIVTSYSYYSPGWLKSIENGAGSSAFSQNIEARFANGQVKQGEDHVTAQTGPIKLQYQVDFDELNQLNSAHYPGEPDWLLSIQAYDPNGNVLALVQAQDPKAYSYVKGSNQLSAIKSGATFDFQATYDANGAIKTVQKPKQTLTFDYVKGGALTASVELGQTGETLSLAYDHNGQRVSKVLATGQTVRKQKIYIHGDHALPLIEIEDGKTIAYIYGPKGLIGFYRDATFYYVSKDQLGSNRLVQDQNGHTIAVYNYQTYGTLGSSAGTNPGILPYLYTGQEWDAELGLYNYRARLYDAALGRFYNTDPKKQTASPYTYVNNDPFDFTDPSGESFWDIFSWIAQIFIDVAEVVAAVAIDVVTLGAAAATPVSGALLGAGISGAVYDVGALATHKKASWRDFGEAQAVGAVSGAVTGGAGALGDAAETGITDATENAVGSALDDTAENAAGNTFKRGAGKLLGKVTNVAIRGAGGVVASVGDKMVENKFDHKAVGDGLGTSALTGFITASVGSTFNQIGGAFVGKDAAVWKKMIKATVVGSSGKVAGGLITDAIKKQKINGLDLGLDAAFGAVTLLVKVRRPLKLEEKDFNPVVHFTSYSSVGTQKAKE